MKTKLLILTTLLLNISALATEANIDPAKRFAGYEPSILESEEKVAETFKGMESDFRMLRPWKLQFGSECTQRAETWSYDLNKMKDLKVQKVFVFYTSAYKKYYRERHPRNFMWWFHVSPYVLVKNAAGETEERVIDKTFSDKPQTMKEWTDIFIESKQPCIENVPFANFEGDLGGEGASYDKSAHCYIVRAPMYDMFPGDIDARERGQKSEMVWDMNQVRFASKALTVGARKSYYERTGLNR